MEAHSQSGLLCELMVESDDARVRECEFVELLVDTGATEHVCEELRVGFTVVEVKRPILSVSRLMDRGIETFIQAGKQFLRRFDGATVELTRRGGLFVLQCQDVVPMLLAPVDEELAGEALDLHLLTRRWSVN